MGTTSPLKITSAFGASPGTDSWLFWRDYVWIFVGPNVNGKTEKDSKPTAKNYALLYQNPVLIICKCYTSVNQLSLILKEKVIFLLWQHRAADLFLALEDRSASCCQKDQKRSHHPTEGSTSDTIPGWKESRGALDQHIPRKPER